MQLKPHDLVARLRAQGSDVVEQTVRVWESYAGRSPSPDNIDALERIFGSQAPSASDEMDSSTIVAAIDRLTAAIELQTATRVEWERGLIEAIAELVSGGVRSGDLAAGPREGARR